MLLAEWILKFIWYQWCCEFSRVFDIRWSDKLSIPILRKQQRRRMWDKSRWTLKGNALKMMYESVKVEKMNQSYHYTYKKRGTTIQRRALLITSLLDICATIGFWVWLASNVGQIEFLREVIEHISTNLWLTSTQQFYRTRLQTFIIHRYSEIMLISLLRAFFIIYVYVIEIKSSFLPLAVRIQFILFLIWDVQIFMLLASCVYTIELLSIFLVYKPNDLPANKIIYIAISTFMSLISLMVILILRRVHKGHVRNNILSDLEKTLQTPKVIIIFFIFHDFLQPKAMLINENSPLIESLSK